MPPDKIGPYKIESQIASGGMNDLYLALDLKSLEHVVLKVLKPKYAENFEMKSRFMREAEIVAQANHPGIVKYYAHGIWEGGLYLALEYLQGTSLRTYIQHTPMTLKRAVELILELCYAVCHLHIQGYIHRDLKPENIFVNEKGQIKLIDFGIARRVYELGQKKVAEEGRFIGTPSYMSPEQKNNPESVSFSSDIYSLGIIAYEMILGKLSHGHVHLLLMPKGIQKIIKKMLEPDPKDRYQDLVDVISDFSDYLVVVIDTQEDGALPLAVDGLQLAVQELVPKALPQWDGIEIDFSFHKGLGIAPVYYDLFTQNERYFILSEPAHQSSKGAIEMAYFRGLERAFRPRIGDLSIWSDLLIKTTLKDPLHPLFALGLLRINPKLKKFEFIGMGEVRLFHISKENIRICARSIPPLGSTDTIDIDTGGLLEQDILILSNSAFVDAVLQEPGQIPELKHHKHLTEYLLHKTKAIYLQEFEQKTLLIASFVINNL